MTPASPQKCATLSGILAGAGMVLIALASAATPHAGAQSRTQPQSGALALAAEQGIRWQELQPAHRSALKPLERDWAGINANQKQKWLEIAARFPTLAADEKIRIQTRMAEWTRLTPDQRSQARVNFQQAKQVSPQDRQTQWETYQSLSPEAKRTLAERAAPVAAPGNVGAAPKGQGAERGSAIGRDAQQFKSNIVPNPSFAVPPRPVAPTVLQAQPGATTTLISKRPVPPPHQQTGLPKIAGSPNFIDKSTLLPQRGPQGAATRSAGASAPETSQR